MDDGHPGLRVILFLILLVIDAIFSGSAAALTELSAGPMEEKADAGDQKAAYILRLIRRPTQLIIATHLIVTSTAMIVGAYVVKVFSAAALNMGTAYASLQISGPLRILLELLVLCVLIFCMLVFGVVLPKRVARKDCERWMYRYSGILQIALPILSPFTTLISAACNALGRIFGIDPKAVNDSVTEEEILMMVTEGHEQGVLEANEAEMIHNIFEFNDKEVADIMTHRKDIVAIDIHTNVVDASRMMLSAPYSRFPVYEDDIENIVGVLHMKDLMRALVKQDSNEIQIRDLMRKPYYVPDTQNIDRLFREMQQKKIHVAIVIDEYGQTAGLVAMEDILEEIVGNIFDEYDLDEISIRKLSDNAWMMRGSAPLDEVGKTLAIEDLDECDFDTLNGLIIGELGHIPRPEEHAKVNLYGYRMEVLTVADNMIQDVWVSKADADPDTNNATNKNMNNAE